MGLFVCFSEKEMETSSGAKNPNRSLYCIQFQKSQGSSPQLGWAVLSTTATGGTGRSILSRLVRCKSNHLLFRNVDQCYYAPKINIRAVNCFHGSVVLTMEVVPTYQTSIIQRGYCFREGMAGSSFVQEEASPQPHDCSFVAGAVLMGYSHPNLPMKAPAIQVHFWWKPYL